MYAKEIDQILQNEINQRTGASFDPGKDKIVEIQGFHRGIRRKNGYTRLGSVRLSILNPTDRFMLAYLIHRAGMDKLPIFCDEVSHKRWKKDNEEILRKTKGRQGCSNKYDALGCCIDNPRWHENGEFNKQAYLNHLKEIDLGPQCIPKAAQKECKERVDIFILRNQFYCYGNPCEEGDPGPPYCRNIMATFPHPDCFPGGVFQKSPKISSKESEISPSQE